MSDHFLISTSCIIKDAKLKTLSSSQTNEQSIIYSKLKRGPNLAGQFQETMSQYPLAALENIDAANESLIDAIKILVHSLGMISRTENSLYLTRQSKPWYDIECKQANLFQKRLHRQWWNSENEILKVKFIG